MRVVQFGQRICVNLKHILTVVLRYVLQLSLIALLQCRDNFVFILFRNFKAENLIF